jgi:sialate O-acetylesterase
MCVVVALLCVVCSAGADVTCDKLFSDHAVLQRNMSVPVWGTASAGEHVTVDFRGQLKSATTDGNGNWLVNLDPMPADSNPGDMVITGDNVITLTGVQVGEVWLASGQSNITYTLGNANDSADIISDAGNHNIRLFRRSDDGWSVSTPDTAEDFSAIGYVFGLDLENNLGLPVGLLERGIPGTSIYTWTHTLGGDASNYESWIVPVQPYAIKGVIWYQGSADGNPTNCDSYYTMLPALMYEWRTDWGQGDFPFAIVQIHYDDDNEPAAIVRDAQLQTVLADVNSCIAVTSDYSNGGKNGWHPDDKVPIGYRLADAARAMFYGQTGFEYYGPLYDEANSYVDGSSVVLNFTHIGGGLTTSIGANADGLDPKPFKVAGSDGIYYDATGQIFGDTVVVTSASVPNPVSVGYIWNYGYLLCNLYNTDALPAFQFLLTFAEDTEAPMLDPMSFWAPPHATSDTSISMTANPTYDRSGVEYYFECVAGGGNDSGWQDNIEYEDSGLTAGAEYSYRVKARDKSVNQNETAWSPAESAMTDPSGGVEIYVSDIAMSWRKAGNRYFGQATVWIKNNIGADVEGAVVYGTWSGDVNGSVQVTTGYDGKVMIESDAEVGGGTFIFTVDDVVKTDCTYNSILNVETSDSITAP